MVLNFFCKIGENTTFFAIFFGNSLQIFENSPASGGFCPPDPLRGRTPYLEPPRNFFLRTPLAWSKPNSRKQICAYSLYDMKLIEDVFKTNNWPDFLQVPIITWHIINSIEMEISSYIINPRFELFRQKINREKILVIL